MKFLADAMLGKLANWLRMMGYDTISANDLPFSDDDYILDVAEDEERILLTKDRELYERAKREGVSAILVQGDTVEEQLHQLVKEAGIELREEPAERCPRCNGVLVRVDKKSVKGMVPATVYDIHMEFWVCESCGQVYWPGTHWKRIRETVGRVRTMD